MELTAFLNGLRDPMGVPFYPIVFQGLLVLTFALHILLVNSVLGALVLALWGRFSRDANPLRLARTLAKFATIGLSVAVVLGVAPLLFVQVIYDPFWYSANLMSAWWAMLFLLLVTGGFLTAYALYLWSERRPTFSRRAGVLSLAAVLAAGGIMHMLNMESLLPQLWSGWFSGAGELETSGWAFKAFAPGRFGHFMLPALINVGVFLMLYAWYLSTRPGSDRAYLDWVARLGGDLARFGMIVQLGFGCWWLFELPAGLRFLYHPALHFGVTVALLSIGLMFWITQKPLVRARLAALLSLGTVLAMGMTREALRMTYLGQFDYSVYNYPLQLDWGSTTLFFVTFLGGLVVLAYPLLVAYRAGRGEQV